MYGAIEIEWQMIPIPWLRIQPTPNRIVCSTREMFKRIPIRNSASLVLSRHYLALLVANRSMTMWTLSSKLQTPSNRHCWVGFVFFLVFSLISPTMANNNLLLAMARVNSGMRWISSCSCSLWFLSCTPHVLFNNSVAFILVSHSVTEQYQSVDTLGHC